MTANCETNFGDHFEKKTALITFRSAKENRNIIFWKIAAEEKFYMLDVPEDPDGAVTTHCEEFLIEMLENGKIGEYYWENEDLNICTMVKIRKFFRKF